MKETYENCHEYTMDYIAEFTACEHVKEEIEKLKKPGGNLSGRYWGAIQKCNPTPFTQNACQDIPTPSLILFTMGDGTILQHTMITEKKDTWIGANNASSLGKNSRGEVGFGVMEYEKMSQKIYKKGVMTGGWCEGAMCNIGGEKYDMYYIPLADIGSQFCVG